MVYLKAYYLYSGFIVLFIVHFIAEIYVNIIVLNILDKTNYF